MQKKILIILMSCFSLNASVVYELVSVENPGNDADITGFGAVSYSYQIGKKQVTLGQYTEFLNAIAAEDPYELYNKDMLIPNVAGILRLGESGSFTYQVIHSEAFPVTSISWFSAARFANWMANGQGAGGQDETTTEDGAYPLYGAVSGDAIPKNQINLNTGSPPLYYIPTEDEWYKAAFYNPTLNEGSGGYYIYATQSNEIPGNAIGDDPNQGNYFAGTGYCVTQSPNFSLTQGYLTDVGSFTQSTSFYGTYDQNGNVWEWNDLNEVVSPIRGIRGGGYTSVSLYLQSDFRILYIADGYNINGGLRLAGP